MVLFAGKMKIGYVKFSIRIIITNMNYTSMLLKGNSMVTACSPAIFPKALYANNPKVMYTEVTVIIA